MIDIEQDARRYAYLRACLAQAIKENPSIAGVYIKPPGKKYWFDKEKDIDDAIDEAMEQEMQIERTKRRFD